MSIILKVSISILFMNLLWTCGVPSNQKQHSATGHWIAIDSNNYNIDTYVFATAKSTKFEINDKERGFLYKLSSTYNPEHQEYKISNIPFEDKEARIFGKVKVIGDTLLMEMDNQLVKFIKK